METRTIVILGIVLAFAVVGGSYWVLTRKNSQENSGVYQTTIPNQGIVGSPSTGIPIQTQNPQPTPQPELEKTKFVDITSSGFNPATVIIPVGGYVIFTNRDVADHWPASDNHPTHEICQGLDTLRPLKPGQIFSFPFDVARNCPIHDHLNPSLKGMITVVEAVPK